VSIHLAADGALLIVQMCWFAGKEPYNASEPVSSATCKRNVHCFSAWSYRVGSFIPPDIFPLVIQLESSMQTGACSVKRHDAIVVGESGLA
jgi:hypothetical protein